MQQPQRLPALTPLTCDEECTRLERNRSLASALGIEINQSTTLAQNGGPALPYSSETLDMYIQLSSSAPLATLQSYESTLHSLAASVSPANRSVRFQPARSSLRAFTHSLAADWGFATESFDPEPHRHVFVLKPVSWKPPVFGLGNGSVIGIGGMSVGECVKLRERQRLKEREAQRVAAAEAKASREAAKTQAQGSLDGGGWAQVAASRKSNHGGSPSTLPQRTKFSSGSYAALAGGDFAAGVGASVGTGTKKERLVLRSGVGTGKQLQGKVQEPVADSWEEEEEKEEEQERKLEGPAVDSDGHAGDAQKQEVDAEQKDNGDVEVEIAASQ